MFWGFSEAIDLFNEYLNTFEKQNDAKSKQCKTSINILLFGASDPRHILKTMAKIYTHKSQGIIPVLNFYLVDGCVEMVARNLLLLSIALENLDILNLRTKVHLFMDVYGNAVMRASTHKYLIGKAKSLVKAITDESCLANLTPLLSFDRMKYRERDGLENALEFWFSKDKCIFNIQECWNVRLRKQMGTRYDYREGQYDWDLNMMLKERDAKQICSQEYRYWRETGIAFTFPEYEYSMPNKTLAAGIVRNGNIFKHRGYVGDMETGPFSAFGLKTNDENMNGSVHGENDYRSTDVTERNLLELFDELATKTTYEHDASRYRKYGSTRFKMSQCLTHHEVDTANFGEYDKPWISIDGVKIHFLSSDEILTFQQHSFSNQWLKFFDITFVGRNYFNFLQDSFADVLNDQSLLIIETKLISTSRKEEIKHFQEKICNYAKRNNFEYVINYNVLNSNNSILKFKNKKLFPQ